MGVGPHWAGLSVCLFQVEFCPHRARIAPILFAGHADFEVSADHFIAGLPVFAVQAGPLLVGIDILTGAHGEGAAGFAIEQAAVDARLHRQGSTGRIVQDEGLAGGRCFAETDDGIRVISFRKANDREVKRYAKAHPIDQA